MQSSSTPVSPEELAIVKNVLARLEAQGTPLHPAMWSSTAVPGSMTDGSKRRLEADDFPSSEDDVFSGGMSNAGMSGFELIRDDVNGAANRSQQPVVPQAKAKSKPDLPEGVSSVDQWGRTICTLPKVKDEAPTYAEIGSLGKYKEYRSWLFTQGKSKGPRVADLRNYMIAAGVFNEDEDVMIPGSSEVRRFRK
eukprot:s49_g6.t1